MAQHAQRVWESSARATPGTVFAYFAAAALHGIDILGPWPTHVDVSVLRSSGGRSTGLQRRRTRVSADVEVMEWGHHFVTTPVQTVIDLAASLSFVHGVVVADQALWARRAGGPLVAPALLTECASSYPGRGALRARRVAGFASGESDSVRESQSRVILEQLGFPMPELQHEFALPSGRRARSDFFWREFDHVGEFDGVGKYLDPALLNGRTPAQALIEEKDREDTSLLHEGSPSRGCYARL
jgi:hypothetical protein